MPDNHYATDVRDAAWALLPALLPAARPGAGLGSLAFLLPAVPHHLYLAIEVLGFLAGLSLCLWLLVMGVNVERWKQQASAGRSSE